MILRFEQFKGELNEAAIPVYRGSSFQPEKKIKSTSVMEEISKGILDMKNGLIKEISVVAEIPTQGKRAPEYLKSVFADAGIKSGDDMYDASGREKSVFVDSEFIVKSVDKEMGTIRAIPYSMKRKGIEIDIEPSQVIEIFYK